MLQDAGVTMGQTKNPREDFMLLMPMMLKGSEEKTQKQGQNILTYSLQTAGAGNIMQEAMERCLRSLKQICQWRAMIRLSIWSL